MIPEKGKAAERRRRESERSRRIAETQVDAVLRKAPGPIATRIQEMRNGEQVEVTYCPCGLGRLEVVTLDGRHIQEFGYGGSGPWNPRDR